MNELTEQTIGEAMDRQSTIDHLISKGHDRDFAEYVVDHKPNSFMAGAARFNVAVIEFRRQLAKALAPSRAPK